MANIDQENMFSIGTAATLLGIRPDTLRYYEKRALLVSKRMENGYRYYTKEDLERLLIILYYRKMDISIDRLPVILENASTSSHICDLLDQQIQAEEDEIFKHQQNITRLNLSKMQHDRTDTYQQGFAIRPFPKSYMMDTRDSFWEIMMLWFRNAQQSPGLDMAYLYDIYSVSSDCADIDYTYSQLFLYEETAAVMPAAFHQQSYPLTPDMDCVTYSYTDINNIGPKEMISRMAAWAKEQGYQIAGNCLITRLFTGNTTNASHNEVELYLPVQKG